MQTEGKYSNDTLMLLQIRTHKHYGTSSNLKVVGSMGALDEHARISHVQLRTLRTHGTTTRTAHTFTQLCALTLNDLNSLELSSVVNTHGNIITAPTHGHVFLLYERINGFFYS